MNQQRAEMIPSEPSAVIYADIGTSCQQLRTRFDVDMREFVVLALLYETRKASPPAVSEVLELSASTVDYCLFKLSGSGLAEQTENPRCEYCATSDGRKLIREAYKRYDSMAPALVA